MIAWPGSLVILSPAYVIALELARHFCFGCSDYDITQDYDYYYTGLRLLLHRITRRQKVSPYLVTFSEQWWRQW